jgi:cell division protein FtsI/penicillin-binding protein 2
MKKQSGFSVVEALLVVAIVGIIGGVGYFVWHSQKQAEKNYAEAEKSSSSGVEVKPSKDKIYDCNLEKQTLPKFAFNKGCFTITFPNSWTIQQYQTSGGVIDVKDFTQNDTNFVFSSTGDVSTPAVKINNFGGGLFIYDDSVAKNNKLPNPQDGTYKKLKNGISIWTTNKTRTEVDGSQVNTECPTIYIASGGVTEQRLPNGRYIGFNGTFCWGQGLKTNMTYDQQINGQEFKDAMAMLESISFHTK